MVKHEWRLNLTLIYYSSPHRTKHCVHTCLLYSKMKKDGYPVKLSMFLEEAMELVRKSSQ
jgi:hypothetical protein